MTPPPEEHTGEQPPAGEEEGSQLSSLMRLMQAVQSTGISGLNPSRGSANGPQNVQPISAARNVGGARRGPATRTGSARRTANAEVRRANIRGTTTAPTNAQKKSTQEVLLSASLQCIEAKDDFVRLQPQIPERSSTQSSQSVFAGSNGDGEDATSHIPNVHETLASRVNQTGFDLNSSAVNSSGYTSYNSSAMNSSTENSDEEDSSKNDGIDEIKKTGLDPTNSSSAKFMPVSTRVNINANGKITTPSGAESLDRSFNRLSISDDSSKDSSTCIPFEDFDELDFDNDAKLLASRIKRNITNLALIVPHAVSKEVAKLTSSTISDMRSLMWLLGSAIPMKAGISLVSQMRTQATNLSSSIKSFFVSCLSPEFTKKYAETTDFKLPEDYDNLQHEDTMNGSSATESMKRSIGVVYSICDGFIQKKLLPANNLHQVISVIKTDSELVADGVEDFNEMIQTFKRRLKKAAKNDSTKNTAQNEEVEDRSKTETSSTGEDIDEDDDVEEWDIEDFDDWSDDEDDDEEGEDEATEKKEEEEPVNNDVLLLEAICELMRTVSDTLNETGNFLEYKSKELKIINGKRLKSLRKEYISAIDSAISAYSKKLTFTSGSLIAANKDIKNMVRFTQIFDAAHECNEAGDRIVINVRACSKWIDECVDCVFLEDTLRTMDIIKYANELAESVLSIISVVNYILITSAIDVDMKPFHERVNEDPEFFDDKTKLIEKDDGFSRSLESAKKTIDTILEKKILVHKSSR